MVGHPKGRPHLAMRSFSYVMAGVWAVGIVATTYRSVAMMLGA